MEFFLGEISRSGGTKKDVSLPMVVGLDSEKQGFGGIFLGEISRSGGTNKDVSLPVVVVLSSRDRDDHLPNVRIYVKEMTDAEKSMLKSQV